jgi:ABC-2 type transport system permease protein
MLKSLIHQLSVEVKLFWRSREAVYLTFLVPTGAMALLVYLHREGVLEEFFVTVLRGLGGEEILTEISLMRFLTVGLITYCLIAVAFEHMTPDVADQRETGILKRLGGTPLRKEIFLLSKTLNASILVFAEVALILAMGRISGEIPAVHHWWLMVGVVLLGTVTFSAMGVTLSNIIERTDAAVAAVHAVYIPMLLLSDAFIPIETLPSLLQSISKMLPLTYVVHPFRSIMGEGTVAGSDLVVLTGWMILFWIIAVKTFRWK